MVIIPSVVTSVTTNTQTSSDLKKLEKIILMLNLAVAPTVTTIAQDTTFEGS